MVLSSGTVSALTPISSSTYSSTYSLTVISPANFEGSINLSVKANAVISLVGNSNEGSTHTQAVDTKKPSVTITTDNQDLVANSIITYTFAFSEDVTGFTVDDITLSKGSLGVLSTQTQGIAYTIEVTPSSDFKGDIGLSVQANKVQDNAGNGNLASTTHTQAVDTENIPPQFRIDTASLTIDEGLIEVYIVDIIDLDGEVGTFEVISQANYFSINPTPVVSFSTESVLTSYSLATTQVAKLYLRVKPEGLGGYYHYHKI